MPACDRSDRRARAGHDLTAREHAVDLRRHQRAVDGEQPALGEQQVGAGDHRPEVGRLADREDDHVGGDLGVVLGELRGEAPLCVEDREAALQAHPNDLAVLDHDAVRTPRAVGDDALVERLLDLPGVRRQLVHRLERGEPRLGRADAKRDTGAVHGDVAAADHEHALALDAGVALPVARAQELERAHDALGVGTGQGQDAALLQAGGDQHRLVLADEVVDGHVFAHPYVR